MGVLRGSFSTGAGKSDWGAEEEEDLFAK